MSKSLLRKKITKTNISVTENHSHPISYNQAKNDVNSDYLSLLNSKFSTNSVSPTINDISKVFKLKQVNGDPNVFSVIQKNTTSNKKHKKLTTISPKIKKTLRSKSRPKTSSTNIPNIQKKSKKRKRSRSKSAIPKPVIINNKIAIEPKKSAVPKKKFNVNKLMKDRIPANFAF